MSDDLYYIDQEEGCFAQCRKASDSSGAEYYVNLECMKKHNGFVLGDPTSTCCNNTFSQIHEDYASKVGYIQARGFGNNAWKVLFLVKSDSIYSFLKR